MGSFSRDLDPALAKLWEMGNHWYPDNNPVNLRLEGGWPLVTFGFAKRRGQLILSPDPTMGTEEATFTPKLIKQVLIIVPRPEGWCWFTTNIVRSEIRLVGPPIILSLTINQVG